MIAAPRDHRGAIWVDTLDLDDPFPVLRPTPRPPLRYDAARLLLRLHGEPLGFVTVGLTQGATTRNAVLAAAPPDVTLRLQRHVQAEGSADGTPPGAYALAGERCPMADVPDKSVSVIVCTRERPEVLRRCLQRLRRLEHSKLEFVVVDNAPTDDATREVVEAEVGQDARFRYVVESRPGLSTARNRGAKEATSEILAFTDDDVEVDPGWVRGLLRGFSRRSDVACVTGLVAAAALDTGAERYFDARVSWSVNCDSQIFDLQPPAGAGGLYPYQPGLFGTGANFAMTAECLHLLGGFDEALGAGSRTGGGEDIDVFVRVVLSSAALAYEPSALVWHHHRIETAELRHQLFAYGTGLTAFLAKHLVDSRSRRLIVRRLPAGLRHLTRVRSNMRRGAGDDAVLPSGLLWHELRGMAAGPFLYSLGRRAARDRPEVAKT